MPCTRWQLPSMNWHEEFQNAISRHHILGVTFWVNRVGADAYQVNDYSGALSAELKNTIFDCPYEASDKAIAYLRGNK